MNATKIEEKKALEVNLCDFAFVTDEKAQSSTRGRAESHGI